MKIQANDIKLLIDEEGRAELNFALASFPYEERGWLRKLKEILAKGKQLDVEVKQHREKRHHCLFGCLRQTAEAEGLCGYGYVIITIQEQRVCIQCQRSCESCRH